MPRRIHFHDTSPTDSDCTVPGAVSQTPGLQCLLRAVPAGPRDGGLIIVVHIAGDIDLASQNGLQVALHGGLHAEPRHLILDLSAVRFCGSRGLAILAAAPRGAARGTTCAVSGLSPFLQGLAPYFWDGSTPTRYVSLAEALADIRGA